MLYSAKVMDHFMNPRNVGIMEDADGVGQVGSARCGDTMKIYLKIQDGIITRATFETFGCGTAHCFQFHGNGIDYRKAPVTGTGSHQSGRGRGSWTGLPEQKLHCSVLAEQAVRAAVRDYYDRSHIPYDPADFPVYEEE